MKRQVGEQVNLLGTDKCLKVKRVTQLALLAIIVHIKKIFQFYFTAFAFKFKHVTTCKFSRRNLIIALLRQRTWTVKDACRFLYQKCALQASENFGITSLYLTEEMVLES